MAVTVDIRSAGSKTVGATSLTMSHTVSAGLTNPILVVQPTTGSGSAVAVSTVSWDTAGVNEACTFRNTHADSNCRAELWDKVGPTAGASKTITVTPASSCEITICASSYQGVDQATPWRGATWPTDAHAPSAGVPQPSIAVTTVAGDMAVACVVINENSSDDTLTATGTTTLVGNQSVGAGKHTGGAGDAPAIGTSTTVSFAGVTDTNNWGIVAGPLQWDGTFGGGGGGPTPHPLYRKQTAFGLF